MDINSSQKTLRVQGQSQGVFIASYQLELDAEAVQDRLRQSVFELGIERGIAMERLRSEKAQLETENRGLKNEITQLQFVHAQELNAAIERVGVTIKAVAEKIQAIAVKLDWYGKMNHNNSMGPFLTPSKDASLFLELYNRISDDLKKYPECCIELKNKVNPAEDIPIAELIGREIPPIILKTTEKELVGDDALKKDNALLRAINLDLIAQKISLINFHSELLLERTKLSKEIYLKKVLELVSSTYKAIQWDKLLINDFYRNNPYMDYSQLDVFGPMLQQRVYDTKTVKIKVKMEKIIADLKAFLDTKSVEDKK